MKYYFTILLSLTLSFSYAQTSEFNILLDSAKTLFKSSSNLDQEAYDKFDYNQVANLLNKAIELNPNSAEAHYFLGYTYSRINSRDGRGIIGMNLSTLYKSTEQFEKVIELSPKYTGEMVILDPYSKLTAEWGSMAMYYWHNDNSDSALWAFAEGKKRGGFSDFELQKAKMILSTSEENSILISQGDNVTFPLWYLQIVEKYRTDISVIDVSLLNTIWYPRYLSKTKSVAFDEPMEVIDTFQYSFWKDSMVIINNFKWLVKPSYSENYLLRGDKVFLSLLKANNFERKVAFTLGFSEEYTLGLNDFTVDKVLIKEYRKYRTLDLSYKQFMEQLKKALKLSEYININSMDERLAFENIRYKAFYRIYYLMEAGENSKAKALLKLVDKYADERKYPYCTENGKEFYDNLKLKLY